MEIKEQHIQYQVAFNQYIKSIQELLVSYSMKEVMIQFPMLEWKNIRLASELMNIQYTIDMNVYCIWELRRLNNDEKKKWLKYIRRHNPTPKQLRSLIRNDRKINKDIPLKTNRKMKKEWLAHHIE